MFDMSSHQPLSTSSVPPTLHYSQPSELLGHAPSALASGKAPADVECLIFNPDLYKMHWTAELNTWWNFKGCLLDIIGDWFASHGGKSTLGTWTLWPVSSTMHAYSFPAPCSWKFFLLAGSLLVQLLLLTFFPFEPCNAHFSSGATVVDGVKHKGRVVAVCVIHANSQIPVVKRDVTVSLQFQS